MIKGILIQQWQEKSETKFKELLLSYEKCIDHKNLWDVLP